MLLLKRYILEVRMSYFPFFIDITNKNCLVVGSGNIAKHKIKILQEFKAKVSCISKDNIEMDNISFIKKEVDKDDIKDYFLVIAATDNKELNKQISSWCREKNILINVVDQKDECSFIFPSIIKKDEIVAAFSSGGSNPIICSYLKRKNQEIIDDKLVNINKKLTDKRKELLNIDYKTRKEILEKLLDEYLSE